MAAATTQRFHDSPIDFDDGAAGENAEIPSASPLSHFQALDDPGAMPRTTIEGKLFLPRSSSAFSTTPRTGPGAWVIMVTDIKACARSVVVQTERGVPFAFRTAHDGGTGLILSRIRD